LTEKNSSSQFSDNKLSNYCENLFPLPFFTLEWFIQMNIIEVEQMLFSYYGARMRADEKF
jgi:hypothetical protein